MNALPGSHAAATRAEILLRVGQNAHNRLGPLRVHRRPVAFPEPLSQLHSQPGAS